MVNAADIPAFATELPTSVPRPVQRLALAEDLGDLTMVRDTPSLLSMAVGQPSFPSRIRGGRHRERAPRFTAFLQSPVLHASAHRLLSRTAAAFEPAGRAGEGTENEVEIWRREAERLVDRKNGVCFPDADIDVWY